MTTDTVKKLFKFLLRTTDHKTDGDFINNVSSAPSQDDTLNSNNAYNASLGSEDSKTDSMAKNSDTGKPIQKKQNQPGFQSRFNKETGPQNQRLVEPATPTKTSYFRTDDPIIVLLKNLALLGLVIQSFINVFRWIKIQADRYNTDTINTVYKSMREKDQEDLQNNPKDDDQEDLSSLDLSFDDTDEETPDNVES